MKIELLPSTIENGVVTDRQHLSCFVIDDRLAVDAGCLSLSANEKQREGIRDVLLTHAHIDHIAGLPLFVDDLFSDLSSPIRVHAEHKVINVLREHIFNWQVYPDFGELENESGPVLEYCPFDSGAGFDVAGFRVVSVPVNHKVPSFGFLIESADKCIALTGDTAETDLFWETLGQAPRLDAVFVECAFPNELEELARVSHHLTPKRFESELAKLGSRDCAIYAINLKPAHHEQIARELEELDDLSVHVMATGDPIKF